jgi:two-component system response regulator YesN
VFSGKLKIGFREYINFLRISHAKTLLVETDMKVLAIMLECGFRNQSTFNRIFSEVCGVSPRTYRKEGK